MTDRQWALVRSPLLGEFLAGLFYERIMAHMASVSSRHPFPLDPAHCNQCRLAMAGMERTGLFRCRGCRRVLAVPERMKTRRGPPPYCGATRCRESAKGRLEAAWARVNAASG